MLKETLPAVVVDDTRWLCVLKPGIGFHHLLVMRQRNALQLKLLAPSGCKILTSFLFSDISESNFKRDDNTVFRCAKIVVIIIFCVIFLHFETFLTEAFFMHHSELFRHGHCEVFNVYRPKSFVSNVPSTSAWRRRIDFQLCCVYIRLSVTSRLSFCADVSQSCSCTFSTMSELCNRLILMLK